MVSLSHLRVAGWVVLSSSGCGLDTYGISGSDATSGAVSVTSSGSSEPETSPTSTSPAVDHCGDGIVGEYEACDDSNQVDQDGCQSDCTVTQGLTVFSGSYSSSTCVKLHGGPLGRCWGDNRTAQLGYPLPFIDGDDASHAIGDAEDELLPDYTLYLHEEIAEVAMAPEYTCLRTVTGGVYCWGITQWCSLGADPLPAPALWNPAVAEDFRIDLGGEAAQISAGGFGACAVMVGGLLRCWGKNQFGVVGDGTETCTEATPVTVSVGDGVEAQQVASGRAHTCVVTKSGEVKCWGAGGSGQLGHGKIAQEIDASKVFAVPLNVDAHAVAGGFQHTCAIVGESRKVRCWGSNGSGELGRGSGLDDGAPPSASTMDVDLGPEVSVVQVGCGVGYTCALSGAGDVFCWGNNDHGQLGYGAIGDVGGGAPDLTPLAAGPVLLGEPALQIAVGAFHVCALLRSGGLRCWGRSDVGQLGLGCDPEPDAKECEKLTPEEVPYF